MRIDDLTALAVPEQPALSPDATRCAYVLRELDADEDRSVRSLWSVGAAEGEARRLTNGPADSSPAWSPDGTTLAFVRAADGPPQIWLMSAESGEPEQLTTLPLGAGTPVWSPDGARIAFSAATDLTPDPARPIVTDRLDYRADGAGYLRTVRKHLFVCDLETKESRQVTRGDWHAGDPAWSPDGGTLAFAAATAADADLRLRAPLWTVDASSPTAEPQLAGLPDGVAGTVSWTADGSALLTVGFVGVPVGHAALLRVPLDGGDPIDLSAPLDRNVMPGGTGYPGGPPQYAGDGSVLFCVRDRGCTHLYAVDETGGDPRLLVGGASRVVAALSVAGGTAAIVLVHGDVVRRGRRPRPRVGCGDGAHRARRECCGARRLRPRGARVHDLGRHRRARLAHSRPERCHAVAASPRHPRWATQRVERRSRRLAPLPPGARGARLDGVAPEPARQRRVRLGLLRRRPRCLGRGRCEGLPRADRPARRRGQRRLGSARRHRATATAVS